MWSKKMEVACLTYLKWLLLVSLVFVFLMPIIWVICSSSKSPGELFQWPPSLFGRYSSLDSCIPAMQKEDFGRYFVNTAFVSVTATLLTLRFNVMVGYAFVKYRFKEAGILFGMVLATLMVPLEVVMIPVFKVIVVTNLYSSLWGLVIPAASSLVVVFLIRQYYVGVPDAYMEAIRIDGTSEFNIFMRIVLPLAKPVVSVLCIFSFMWRWNDYLWPRLVVDSKTRYAIQPALANYSGEYSVDQNSLLAMSVISMVPITIVFLTLQKYIVGGLTAGGVKG